jgi:hypothetical protein
MIKPKECPMRDCGSSDVKVIRTPTKIGNDLKYYVVCFSCGAKGKVYNAEIAAIRAWNGEEKI